MKEKRFESKKHSVYGVKGEFLGEVNRTYQDFGEDSYIDVELPCGYKESFWLLTLTNKEYINRTKELKELFHNK